jgi:hypothetical protein
MAVPDTQTDLVGPNYDQENAQRTFMKFKPNQMQVRN